MLNYRYLLSHQHFCDFLKGAAIVAIVISVVGSYGSILAAVNTDP